MSISPTETVKSNSANIIKMVIGACILSLSPVFVKLSNTGPVSTAFYRMSLGGIILLIFTLVRRESVFKGIKPLLIACACGLFFTFDLTFWHQSILSVGPGLATILASFQVFIIAAVGVWFYKEYAGWKLYTAIPLAVIGILLLCGINWSLFSDDYKTGILFGLISAVCYAVYILTIRKSQRLVHKLSPMPNLVMICLVSTVLLGIEAAIRKEDLIIPDWQSLGALVGYGGLCQGLAWVLISYAMPKVEASRIGLILLLQPALAMTWDILFFGRPTTPWEMGGAFIALFAIYLGSTSQKRVVE